MGTLAGVGGAMCVQFQGQLPRPSQTLAIPSLGLAVHHCNQDGCQSYPTLLEETKAKKGASKPALQALSRAKAGSGSDLRDVCLSQYESMSTSPRVATDSKN